MIKLYGIMQELGECEETQGIDFELQQYIGRSVIAKRYHDRYKQIKPFRSKSGVKVFKGFADSKTLASISKVEKNYQRKINDIHKRKLEEYLLKNHPKDVYFPEVTLLYMYDDGLSPETLPFQSIIKDFSDKKAIQVLSTMHALSVYSLTLQEGDELFRLDGNHRLSVLGEAANMGIQKDNNKRRTQSNIFKTNRLISFCIVLTPKVENYSIEHLYFYLLNAKALPIASIKVLELITNANKDNFLKEFIDKDKNLSLLNSIKDSWKNFDDEEKEILLRIIEEMVNNIRQANQQQVTIDELKEIFEQSIGIYRDAKMKKHILGVICFLRLNSDNNDETQGKLNEFYKWVERFNYNISHFKNFSDLYEAFVKYNEEINKKRYIFVAMEYNEEYIKFYTNIIKNVAMGLKSRFSTNFELIDIMQQTSDTNILDNIFNENIPKCDIFIADTSTNNVNVLFEYGYAKAKGKYVILLHSKEWRNKTIKEIAGNSKGHIKKIRNDLEQGIFDTIANHRYEWENERDLSDILKQELENYLKENQLD